MKQPFEKVVEQHGGTVLRVCRVLLGVHDAEEHPAHAQHGPPVLLHDLLERLLHPMLTWTLPCPHLADAPGMPNVRW